MYLSISAAVYVALRRGFIRHNKSLSATTIHSTYMRPIWHMRALHVFALCWLNRGVSPLLLLYISRQHLLFAWKLESVEIACVCVHWRLRLFSFLFRFAILLKINGIRYSANLEIITNLVEWIWLNAKSIMLRATDVVVVVVATTLRR